MSGEDRFLDYLQQEPDEDIRIRRRKLADELPENLCRALDREIEELAAKLTLIRTRTQNKPAGVSDKELLEAYLEKEKRKKSKERFVIALEKQQEQHPAFVAEGLRAESLLKIRTLIAPLSMEETDRELLVKEVTYRAFRLAVKNTDCAHFLGQQNY